MAKPDTGTSFIYQVNSFIRQETVTAKQDASQDQIMMLNRTKTNTARN